MIELENLNNQSFEDIVELAKKQITYLSDDWTNLQESDPGITLIELFAWLKVVQQNYMNRVKEESKYKFLKLLNIQQKQNKAASTLISVSNVAKDMIIPKGTKWCMNNMEFENDRPESILDLKIVSTDFGTTEEDSNVKYESFDGNRVFSLFGETPGENGTQPTFKINLDKPISSGKKVKFYFEIFCEKGLTRNPVTPGDGFIDMAKVVWEFYGEKNKQVGWHKVRVLSDDTHKFLFSGVVTLQFKGKMLPVDELYSLRVRVIDQDYDFWPRVTRIETNVFEVAQKSTVCEKKKIKKLRVSKDNSFSVYTNLALYGKHYVYVRTDDSWEQIDSFKFKRKIDEGKTEFYVENLNEKIKNYNVDDDVVMVISYDESVESNMILADGTGISFQKIENNFENVLYDDFDLMLGYYKNKKLLFDVWNKVQDLYSSSKFDKDYILDCEKGIISFGDNEMGVAPRKGKDNIRLCNLAFTYGEKSNIKSNMINVIKSENSDLKNLKISQICAASGGRDAQSFEDAKREAINLSNYIQRAVLEKDYEEIAQRTPGLIIKKAKALPYYIDEKGNKKEHNCVTVLIRGGNDQLNFNFKNYEENIKKNLDKYRLLNTKVFVKGPKYIGININGQIVMNSYYRKSSDIVVESIKQFIENLNENYGQTLYYGELFGILDRLECVSYVDKLSISTSDTFLDRSVDDDIVIPPNGIYYIDNIDLSYIKSASI